MKRACFALMVAAAGSGCGTSIDFAQVNTPPHRLAPRPPESVQVFQAQKPDRPFVEVGILEAQQETRVSLDGLPEMLQKLRERAAQIGCDGLVIVGPNDAVAGQSGQGGTVGTLKGYRASCIAFTEPAAPAAQPATPAQGAIPAAAGAPPPK